MTNRTLLYSLVILLLVTVALAEITIVQETPYGDTILTTVDTQTATPISQTGYFENAVGPSAGYSGPLVPGFVSDTSQPIVADLVLGERTTTYDYRAGTATTTFTPYSIHAPVGGGYIPPVTTPTQTYYDNNDYSPPYSPPCACSSGQVDVSTTTCSGGCGLQVRTCDSCYWSSQTCDNNRRPAGVPATETICGDNLDNNCDGNEADYDGGTIKNKGDLNCKVSLSSVSTVVNNPNENDALEVTCNANAGNLRSVKASIGGVDCTAGVKTGNSYRFNCNAGTVTQESSGREVKCYVDASRSYQEGTDKTVNVDVCKLVSAEWSNPSARQYEDVRLNVITTQGCNGKEVKFFVKNVLTGRNAAFAPRSANVVNGRSTSTWTVEFESLNGQNPLYYFTAAID